MSNYQRQKGKRVERAAAARWRSITGGPARRSVQYCGSDGTADLIAQEGLHIEVKGRKAISAVRFHDQAKSDAKPGALPIVLMKEDRGDFLIMLCLDDLPRLLELIGNEQRGEQPPVVAP
jgi:hypothetical protein